ncbi:MAG: cytochrome c-type biogenesis protein CcmH, partial [bacterium]
MIGVALNDKPIMSAAKDLLFRVVLVCVMLLAPRLAHTQGASPSIARDSALEARTSAVAAELRCPVCQGLSIQDSPSELAQSMRSLVRDQLADGKSPDQVKAYFVSKYGEWILLAPKAHGFNVL